MTVRHEVKSGGLSDEDKVTIERLASSLKKPAPGPIARRISKHPNTVWWYMVTRGLIQREIKYDQRQTYVRNGRTVYRYTREQDARIVELRRQGKSRREIAEIVSVEFGIHRDKHSIEVRLTMLGAYSGGPEGDAP